MVAKRLGGSVWWFVAVAFVLIAAVGATNSIRPAAAETGATTRSASHTLAVVVGIDKYANHAQSLRSAANDARVVDRALAAAGVADADRRLLVDSDATAGQIRSAVRWLVERATPDTTAVLFFAGHARTLAPGQQALLASDGGSISDAELAATLRPLHARRMWIGLATCYSAGFTELLTPGRVLSAAATATEKAYENDRLQHSYFVDSLIVRGLDGDFSTRSIQDAHDSARDLPTDRRPTLIAPDAEPLIIG